MGSHKYIWDIEDEPQATEQVVEEVVVEQLPPPKPKEPFRFSQTLIKTITNKGHQEKDWCPRFVNEIYVAKNFEFMPTYPMLLGQKFEQLAIGSSADGKPTTLPRHKRTGLKRVSEERAEIQAMRFKQLAQNHDVDVVEGYNTQIPIYFNVGNLPFRAIFDIFPTSFCDPDTGEIEPCAIDLKYTGDVNNTFGEYCYGEHEHLDYLQADTYLYGLSVMKKEDNLHLIDLWGEETFDRILSMAKDYTFIYWVFGNREPINEQFRVIRRKLWDKDLRARDLLQRIRLAVGLLSDAKNDGWQPRPFSSLCKNCPVNVLHGGYCDKAYKVLNA